MKIFTYSLLAILVISGWIQAQPGSIPPGGNDRCDPSPGAPTDTVVAAPDAEGFRKIFNGEDLTGWWESCQSPHSGPDRTNGGIWIAVPELEAIFSQQTTGGAGSILMTNKVFDNYEIQFDFWPDFGNDAGIFHRTNQQGRCYQTVMDYLTGSSMGGVWGENGYASINIQPYSMGGSENSVNYGSGQYRWEYDGSWSDAWDTDGWNQWRIEVFGNPPRVRTYQRILGNSEWIPVLDHTSDVTNQPEGFIGLQIHSGTNRWGGRQGNWYRNIKVRPLDADGNPTGKVGCKDTNYVEYDSTAEIHDPELCETVSVFEITDNMQKVQFHLSRPGVNINLPGRYTLKLVDTKGSLVQKQSVEAAGRVVLDANELKTGLYFLQVISDTEFYSRAYLIQ